MFFNNHDRFNQIFLLFRDVHHTNEIRYVLGSQIVQKAASSQHWGFCILQAFVSSYTNNIFIYSLPHSTPVFPVLGKSLQALQNNYCLSNIIR